MNFDWIVEIEGSPSDVFEFGDYIYVVGEDFIEKRSKWKGGLVKRREFDKKLSVLGAFEGRVYVYDDSTLYGFNAELELFGKVKTDVIKRFPSIIEDATTDGEYLYIFIKKILGKEASIIKMDLNLNRKRDEINIYLDEKTFFSRVSFNPTTRDLWIVTVQFDSEKEKFPFSLFHSEKEKFSSTIEKIDMDSMERDFIYAFGGICSSCSFDEKGNGYLAIDHVSVKVEDRFSEIVKFSPKGHYLFSHRFEKFYTFSDLFLFGEYCYAIQYMENNYNLLVLDSSLNPLNEYFISFNPERILSMASDGRSLYILSYKDKYFLASLILPRPEVKEGKNLRPEVRIAGFSEVLFSDVLKLLRISIKNLLTDFGCSKWQEVDLDARIAPGGFEGRWNCCLLGCGGWGCAYLCKRGEDFFVFKVPWGFESLIIGGEIPSVSLKLMEKVRREAEIVTRLEHPNVLKLISFSSSFPLLVYEFAEQRTIEWQLSKGWEPELRDVLLVGIQMADALRYIHSRGLVFGDLKPGNVFLKGGISKLGDFSSITRLLSASSGHSAGYTVGFRAPEQVFSDLWRKSRETGLENRIDVYQLGNLLLYLLTGDSIDGEELDEVAAKEKARETGELESVLLKCFTLDPLCRASAEDVLKDLLSLWKKKF
jgi:serine/threonine protein kinase